MSEYVWRSWRESVVAVGMELPIDCSRHTPGEEEDKCRDGQCKGDGWFVAPHPPPPPGAAALG